ncbi:uncharacterized protein RJT21DRAFT_122650 [Scheffersomyces amazonensis]|uniref:uncharacterized protein n=1 Tax=Scheffersomyces amazonensis TaxID=1078765 RepID=UPI00315D4B53
MSDSNNANTGGNSDSNQRPRQPKPKRPSNNRKRGPVRGPKSRSSTPVYEPTKDPKFLQVSKLVRTFKPITINGVPTKKIIENIKKKEEDEPEYFKSQYKNSARLSNLQKHFLEFIKNNADSVLYLSFIIKPSDPDFPFDLDRLKINLSIPAKYPQERPSIVVLNEEIPRGFAVNIEIGFRRIVNLAQNLIEKDEEIELVSGSGLLSIILTLDKYLELFLKQEKKDTIKFVKNIKKKVAAPSPEPTLNHQPSPEKKEHKQNKVEPKNNNNIDPKVIEARDELVEELINKLGKDNTKLFKRNKQESQYKITLPILSHQAESIPNLWKLNQGLDIMIKIPIDYPQSPSNINIANNFNTNLILKYEANKETSKDQKTIFEITKSYKQIERNFSQNVSQFFTDVISKNNNELLTTVNWITNYMGQFCLDNSDFNVWKHNFTTLRQQV